MAAWRARPLGAWAVRVAVVVVPLVASVVAAVVASRTLTWPAAQSLPWWAAVVGAAMVTSLVVGRLARRLLPLAALLQLSLVFPDRTPSRFRIALRCGTTAQLQRRIAQVRAHGVGDDVDVAAETVLELAAALNVHDAATRGHSERVRALTEVLAEELRLSEDDRDRLRWSALLHDCGKLMVHADVLNKTEPLTRAEWEEIRRHPEEGAKLTLPLRGWLGPWAAAIEEHHERWDGKGYPNGVAGEGLSYGARIVAVADAYDVITCARSYQPRRTPAEARAELAAHAGTQFDPAVVRAFLAVSLGRAGWWAAPLSWLSGLAVVRQLSARTPADAPGTAVAGAALALAGLLGLFGVDGTEVGRSSPAARSVAVGSQPAEPEPEVLGLVFTNDPVPELPPAPVASAVPAAAVPARATAPRAVTPTTTPAPTVAPVTVPPTTVPPTTVPPPAGDGACTSQALTATSATPAASTLAAVRLRQAEPARAGNPNCAPVRPGE